MKYISSVIIVFSLMIVISCSKEKNYNIKIKDGVEIITNKNIESSPELKLNLKLISEISLNKLVLPDSVPAMEYFYKTALDDDGNIYISDFRKSIVYKMGRNGNYVTNFHRKGQGPGESLVINDIKIINDFVFVFGESGKTSIFTKTGDFVRQLRLLDGKYRAFQIMNSDSNIICNSRNTKPVWDESKQYTTLGVHLLDINNLENYLNILEINSTEDLNNFRYLMHNEQRQFSFYKDKIYVEDLSITSYAVDVYDLNGNKIRRIKKQTHKIPCSDKFKEEVHKKDQKATWMKLVADYMKQILRMYVDKNGYLWIKPAVAGLEFDHQYFDIFNSKGIFLKRIILSLPDSFEWLSFDKDRMIARDRENCIVKVFDYEFIY